MDLRGLEKRICEAEAALGKGRGGDLRAIRDYLVGLDDDAPRGPGGEILGPAPEFFEHPLRGPAGEWTIAACLMHGDAELQARWERHHGRKLRPADLPAGWDQGPPVTDYRSDREVRSMPGLDGYLARSASR